MTDSANPRDGHDAPDACENCATPLQGEFCHQCGQSMHNPIRHAGHAVEEFFEAFWHLDGRLFRTLRDLVSPGRVAINYLAGHRQRYIAPLRLFVVLSLLTFFIGALTIHLDTDPASGTDVSTITDSQTVEEVKRNRDRLLAEVEQARADTGNLPGVDPVLIAVEVKIRGEAANRVSELQEASPTAPSKPAPIPGKGELFSTGHEAWDPEKNRVEISWLPGFANAWLTGKLGDANANIQRMEGRPDLWFKAFMASVPSALFVLVPVFALLLKLAYLFKRRLYLEHMVVALYSHAFLLIALTVAFVLAALDSWLAPHAPWLGVVFTALLAALLAWMPVYLLLMQKRVYGQGWWLTSIKYAVIGMVYVYLLAFAAAITFLARLVQA